MFDPTRSLPMAPSCALDAGGLREQLDRYRQVGLDARLLERTSRRLLVELSGQVDDELVERAISIERECCPFFELDFEPHSRRLSVAVSEAEHEPALEAIAFALGLGDPAHESD